MSRIAFGAINQIKQNRFLDARTQKPNSWEGLESKQSNDYGRQAFAVIQEKLAELPVYHILQSTSDRISLSVVREPSPAVPDEPMGDHFKFQVSLDSQVVAEKPFNPADWYTSYGNMSAHRFSERSVQNALTATLKAVIDLSKSLGQA